MVDGILEEGDGGAIGLDIPRCGFRDIFNPRSDGFCSSSEEEGKECVQGFIPTA